MFCYIVQTLSPNLSFKVLWNFHSNGLVSQFATCLVSCLPASRLCSTTVPVLGSECDRQQKIALKTTSISWYSWKAAIDILRICSVQSMYIIFKWKFSRWLGSPLFGVNQKGTPRIFSRNKQEVNCVRCWRSSSSLG